MNKYLTNYKNFLFEQAGKKKVPVQPEQPVQPNQPAQLEQNDYTNLLTELTWNTTPAGQDDNIEPILLRYGFQKDEDGNYFIRNEESHVLFTSHCDNYCKDVKEVHHVFDGGVMKTDGTTILGADNKAGICYLISLINAGRKYNYYIFKSEEIGRLGSKALYEHDKEFLQSIKLAIAIDRGGTTDLITMQGGHVCCSDETANELKQALGAHGIALNLSKEGGRCDTYTLKNIVPECVNMSDGVFNEHSVNEYIDLHYFNTMIKALSQIDFENISINRYHDDFETFNIPFEDDIVVDPETTLHTFRIKLDDNGDITCYFTINEDEQPFKVYFNMDLHDINRGKLIKVNLVKKGQLKPKVKDVEFGKRVLDLDDAYRQKIIRAVHRYFNNHRKYIFEKPPVPGQGGDFNDLLANFLGQGGPPERW